MVVLHNEADDLEEDLKIQVWNEIVGMVNNNCKEFCEVASKAEINSLLKRISSQASTVTNTFLKESVSSLQSNIDITLSKVSTVESN